MWFSRAFLSVITPLEVETIAIPRPFRTLGSSSAPAYTLRPGLETRRRPVMTCCFLARYLRVMDHALVAVIDHGVGLDVALVQQNLGNSLLQIGSGDIHGFVLRRVRIPDTGQHICYGIGDLHVYILL